MSDTGSAARLVREATQRLQRAGLPHARQEAQWLVSALVGLPPLELYLEDPVISTTAAARLREQLEARAAGAPLQYLLGEADFCGMRLSVGPGVFIPRPETEALVEQALPPLRELARTAGRPLRLLDLGAGSGAIALAVARALPACVVVGIEVSWSALQRARQNIRRHGLEGRVALIQGSWADAIRAPVDGILTNPPYVPSGQVDGLALDVRQEPRGSLDGGPDGLRDVRHLLGEVPRLLAPDGLLVMECGEEQVSEVLRLVQNGGWAQAATPLTDLARRPRGVLVRRRPVSGIPSTLGFAKRSRGGA